jgi:hypothetical protein
VNLTISIIDSNFINISGSNNRALIVDGNVSETEQGKISINILNSGFSDITVSPASTYGGLIYSNFINSNISLNNVIFSNISIYPEENGMVYGGVIYFKQGNNISISGTSFDTISGGSKGGVLYMDTVVSVITINNSSYTECKAAEHGGCVFFGDDVAFQITSTNFTSCFAESNGAGIYSSSSGSGVHILQSCLFSNNSLGVFPSIGIDIFDSSNSAASYYKVSTVVNCWSNSSFGVNDILFAGTVSDSQDYLKFDCLLIGECETVGDEGTNVHMTNGEDFDGCGTEASPCKTLMYAVNKTPSDQWVNVLYDTNPSYSMNMQFPGRVALVRGISSSEDPPQKPKFHTNFSSNSQIIYHYDGNAYTTLDNFVFMYDLNPSSTKYRFINMYASYGELNLWFFYLFLFICFFMFVTEGM